MNLIFFLELSKSIKKLAMKYIIVYGQNIEINYIRLNYTYILLSYSLGNFSNIKLL